MSQKQEEPVEESKIIAVDLAKDVFEVALANAAHRVVSRQRLSRSKFRALLESHPPALVVMEACGSAHDWGRRSMAAGHQVKLLPAQYVRPYRRGNKTDRADTDALLEAHRCEGIKPVPVRSVEQQQIQQLHRIREQWKRTRVQRINGLRGFLRELGHAIPTGALTAQRHAREILDGADFPPALRASFTVLLDEIKALEANIRELERQLAALTRHNPVVRLLTKVSGVGLLTSTALLAAAGSPHHFKSGRHFSSWLGLTAREFSSGSKRRLGKITKRGDTYLRMLLIHGARSVLTRARQLQRAGQRLNRIQLWVVQLEARVGYNKASVALANKLARICWATWKYERDFDPNFAIR
jgi:transposase